MNVILVLVLAISAIVIAEPPVPNSRYLPTSSIHTSYSSPLSRTRSFYKKSLSSQYATPTQHSIPSSSTITPIEYSANGYIAPSQNDDLSNQNDATSNYNSGLSQVSSQYIVPFTQYGTPSSQYVTAGIYGKQAQSNYNNEPANYNFQYDVQEQSDGTDFGHAETRQGDVARGKYYVTLPDGKKQTVEYTADEHGYQPQISYEQTNNLYISRHAAYGNNGFASDSYAPSKYSADKLSDNEYTELNGYQY